MFETPEAWKLWDAHSIDGWYLGSSLEHYRNSVIWVKNSRAERISDTVWFKFKHSKACTVCHRPVSLHNYQSKFTPGLWSHEMRSTKFALAVDNFGIKYESNEDAQHLIDSLTPFYKITVDKDGKQFIGLTLIGITRIKTYKFQCLATSKRH